MADLLISSSYLRRALEVIDVDSSMVTGFLELTSDNMLHVNLLFDSDVIEVLDIDRIKHIFKSEIQNHLNTKIYLEIRTSHINSYFESFNDFLNANKFKLEKVCYYIAEVDFFFNGDGVNNNLISNYNKNIEFISLLGSLSHSNYPVGNQLKYYFYKISSSIVEIDIKYTVADLDLFTDLNGFKELQNEFSDPISHKDKKELFINELVNFIESNSGDYLTIVKKWKTILNAYDKSYKLYLAGFSFDKIKTASNDHFQKLLDKIYDSISKVSGYIFGIPIGFILLLNYFDYTGSLIFKNIVILILSILFFVLIWFILLRNIKESIEVIETDIDDFIKLISSVPVLNPIKEKLENLKKVSLKKQRNKLLIVRGVTISIFALTVIVFIYIFLDISVYL
jgi:hypothetical protein